MLSIWYRLLSNIKIVSSFLYLGKRAFGSSFRGNRIRHDGARFCILWAPNWSSNNGASSTGIKIQRHMLRHVYFTNVWTLKQNKNVLYIKCKNMTSTLFKYDLLLSYENVYLLHILAVTHFDVILTNKLTTN